MFFSRPIQWYTLMQIQSGRTVPLLVPSGRNGSASEWYQCIGLKQDINRYMFLRFFNFDLEYLKRVRILSRFIQKWIQPPACWITVCLEFFLPIGCLTFICWKNPPKYCSILIWIVDCWFSSNILLTSRNPKSNCCPLLHFWSAVWQKRSRLVHMCQGKHMCHPVLAAV